MDFKTFLKLLETRKVEYLVLGGYAVAFHGYPRPTVDFDEAYRNRIRAQFDDVEENLISLEDLKRNKRAAGRNKDLADLDHLPGGSLDQKAH